MDSRYAMILEDCLKRRQNGIVLIDVRDYGARGETRFETYIFLYKSEIYLLATLLMVNGT